MTGSEDHPVLVIANMPAFDQADDIGRSLVQDQLAAAVNLMPGIVSHYIWQGTLASREEVTMIIKTVRRQAGRVVERVRQLHADRVPSIIVIAVEGGNHDYLDWIRQNSGGQRGG